MIVAYLLYRLARILLIEDPVAAATFALTADFLFGSAVNWLLTGLVLYVVARNVSSPLTSSVWSCLGIAGVTVWIAIVWFELYNPAGSLVPTIETFYVSLLGPTLFSASLFVLLTGSLKRSTVLLVACFMLGYITSLLLSTSPVPELLIGSWLLWVLVQSLKARNWQRPRTVIVDLEERIGTATMIATQEEKGIYILILSLTGFLTALIILFAIVSMFIDFDEGVPPEGWGAFVFAALVFGLYAAYGMWYWLGFLRRLPAFIDYYRGRSHSVTHTRPTDYMVPASLHMLSTGILIEYPHFWLPGVFGVVVSIAWMGRSVYKTKTTHTAHQPISADGRVVCLAFVIQHLPILLIVPEVSFALVFLPLLYYLPEIRERSRLLARSVIALVTVAFVGIYWLVLGWPPAVDPLLSPFVLPVLFALFVALVHSVDFEDVNQSERSAGIPHVVGDGSRTNNVDRRVFLTHGSGILGLLSVGWLLRFYDTEGEKLAEVIEEFLVAMHDGDTDAAMEFVHDDSPDAWLYEAREAELQIVELYVADRDGDTAEVWVTYQFVDHVSGDSGENEEAIELRKQDDAWRIYRFVTAAPDETDSEDGGDTDETETRAPWLVLDATPEYNDQGEISSVKWTRTGGDPVDLSRLGAYVRLTENDRDPQTVAEVGTLGDGTLEEDETFRVDVDRIDATEGDELQLFWSANEDTTRRSGPRYVFESNTSSGIRDQSIGDVGSVRYDAAITGHAPTVRGPTEAPAIQWSFGAVSVSDPVVSDGTVYVSSDDRVYALDALFGTRQWSFDAVRPSTPTIRDGVVFVGSADGRVYALEGLDGSVHWSFETDGTFEFRPVVVSDTLYVLDNSSNQSRLYALDAIDGGERWQSKTEAETASSLSATEDAIYVVTVSEPTLRDSSGNVERQCHVSAREASNGAERWRFTTSADRLTTPVVANESVYTAATGTSGTQSTLYVVDEHSGDVQWTLDLDGVVDAPPAVDGNNTYVSHRESWGDRDEPARYRVSAIDAFDGAEQWTFEAEVRTVVESSPTVVGEMVYVGSADWKLYALERTSGNERWAREVGSLFSPVVIDGKVYVRGDNRLYGLF